MNPDDAAPPKRPNAGSEPNSLGGPSNTPLAPQAALNSPYEFSVFLTKPTGPYYAWFTALTAEEVGEKLALYQARLAILLYQARLTSLSAYVDVDNVLKFAIVIAAVDGQQSWWYPGLTKEQVDMCLRANQARLTNISAYIDVDNTLKFAVVMAADGQQSWWYPGLTKEQVAAKLRPNQARLTNVSAYIDVDNTLKFAVAMIAGSDEDYPWYLELTADPGDTSGSVDAKLKAHPGAVPVDVSAYTDIDNTLKCAVVMAPGDQQQSWWYDSFDNDEISEQVSASGTEVALLAAHLPAISGAIRAAFISPDLYLGTTWSSDGINWPTSPYVGIGKQDTQPNAFGSPSFVYFGGAYRVGYLKAGLNATGEPWIASSADGVSKWVPTQITPDGGWDARYKYQSPTSTSPILAAFKGKLWAAFLQTHQHWDGTHTKDDDTGWLVICSSSDCEHVPAIKEVFPNSGTAHFSICPPSLAVFDDKLWLAFVSAIPLGHVMITSSTDGSTWSDPIDVTGNPVTQSAVSLASFHGRLWLAYGATYKRDTELLICSSPDGLTWSTPKQVQGQKTPTAPSLITFANKLWLAFVLNYDPNFSLLICSSPNGERWSPPVPMNQSTTGGDWSDRNMHSPYKGVALCATTVGQISPLYKLLSIVYAPPGGAPHNGSSVEYGGGNTVSTTTSVSDTFNESISVDVSVGDSASNLGAGFSASTSKTQSSSFTTTNNWTDVNTFWGSGAGSIDHLEDQFCLWLNPIFDVTADVEGNLDLRPGVPANHRMDTIWVYARELQNPDKDLKGDIADRLKKRGLTKHDFGQILACNPFFAPDFNPAQPPDPARFAETPTASPIYRSPSYPDGKQDMSKVACTITTSRSDAGKASASYGVSYSLSAGLKDVFKTTAKHSFMWTDTTEETDTTTKTHTAVATIYGPSYEYTGSTSLVVYWDKIYQTFMFAFDAV